MFYFIFALFLLFGLALAVPTFQNFGVSTQLTLYVWHISSMPLGLLLLFTFLSGAFFLYLVSMISAWHDRRQLKFLRHRLAESGLIDEETAASSAHSVDAAESIIPMPGLTHPSAEE